VPNRSAASAAVHCHWLRCGQSCKAASTCGEGITQGATPDATLANHSPPALDAATGGEREDMSDRKPGVFNQSFAEYYDRYLVPMQFAPYARILADRAKALAPARVLETAAGTGIVTQQLASRLPAGVAITATDLNQPMIDHARAKPGMADVIWRQADAMNLPFPDGSFDLIVCQFGVMFFPDKRAAFREASRALCPRGTFLFNVWNDYGAMADAPIAIAADVAAAMLEREPLSLLSPPYHDEDTIRADLAAAGFGVVRVEPISQPAHAASARDAAVITVQGSMIRAAIEAVDPGRLDEATDAVERALLARFGAGPIEGTMSALIVTAEKPPA
jgi:ubiquinone/menaquinone biosynthesis C-methylase UbiE